MGLRNCRREVERNKAGGNRSNQVASRAHTIADDHGTTAKHRFVYHETECFVARRQHQQVRGLIDWRQLRLVDESQEPYTVSNAQRGSFRFEFRAERPISRKN